MNSRPDVKNNIFNESNIATMSRRWLIRLIDGSVLFVLSVILYTIAAMFIKSGIVIISLCLVWVVVYMVGLKSTRYGTLGFLIADVKVVGKNGKPVSLYKNLLRLSSWAFFPYSVFYDLYWMNQTGNLQTFSDRVSETYVVNKDFKPYGVCSA